MKPVKLLILITFSLLSKYSFCQNSCPANNIPLWSTLEMTIQNETDINKLCLENPTIGKAIKKSYKTKSTSSCNGATCSTNGTKTTLKINTSKYNLTYIKNLLKKYFSNVKTK